MTNCNFVNIPMKVGYFIDMQKPKDYKKAEIKLYQQLIDKLIYLLCGIKPDIFFAVRQLSKHNTDPQIGYLKLAKKVEHYLKNTIHLGLIYGGHLKDEEETKILIISFSFGLIRYGDGSYAGDSEN